MALITAAQVREHVPQISGSADDTTLNTMVTRADALLAVFCGWPRTSTGIHTLEVATYVLYPFPESDRPRALSHGLRWVGSITSAYVDENEEYGASTAVASGDMRIDNDEGVVWLKTTASSAWSSNKTGQPNKLTIVNGIGTGGLVTTAPEWLVALVAHEVRHLLMKRRLGEVRDQSSGSGNVTPQDVDALIPKAVQLLCGPLINWRSRLG